MAPTPIHESDSCVIGNSNSQQKLHMVSKTEQERVNVISCLVVRRFKNIFKTLPYRIKRREHFDIMNQGRVTRIVKQIECEILNN